MIEYRTYSGSINAYQGDERIGGVITYTRPSVMIMSELPKAVVWVFNLRIEVPFRKNGYARRLMQRVIAVHGHQQLELSASPSDDHTDVIPFAKLVAFYQSLGFVADRISWCNPPKPIAYMYRKAHEITN
jgi:GNAT superfamily N-acetyltransferase